MLASSAKKQAQPTPAPPAPPQQANPLAQLFAAAGVAAAEDKAPKRIGTPAALAPVAGSNRATRQKVRQAFSRLLANDTFVDLVTKEFLAAGLITE